MNRRSFLSVLGQVAAACGVSRFLPIEPIALATAPIAPPAALATGEYLVSSVLPAGPGVFPTLSAAMAFAQPGDTIRVLAGHRESGSIEGNREVPIHLSEPLCITAENATIRNCTFVGTHGLMVSFGKDKA